MYFFFLLSVNEILINIYVFLIFTTYFFISKPFSKRPIVNISFTNFSESQIFCLKITTPFIYGIYLQCSAVPQNFSVFIIFTTNIHPGQVRGHRCTITAVSKEKKIVICCQNVENYFRVKSQPSKTYALVSSCHIVQEFLTIPNKHMGNISQW